MEQVASALEKRISSLNAGISRSTGLGFNSDNTATEGTSQRLLRSASLGKPTTPTLLTQQVSSRYRGSRELSFIFEEAKGGQL